MSQNTEKRVNFDPIFRSKHKNPRYMYTFYVHRLYCLSLEHSDNEAVLHMHSYVGREEVGGGGERKSSLQVHTWMKYPEMRELALNVLVYRDAP